MANTPLEVGGHSTFPPGLPTNKSLLPEAPYIPECLRITSPSVASMTMPVNQITRAHSKTKANFGQKRGSTCERNAWTDANYSSGLSDAESRTGGYQSDTHLIEAACEARKLQMTGRRLELDFHRSNASLTVSPGRTRTYSGGHSTPSTKRYEPGHLSSSAKCSKFDLTQVYDGLLPPREPTSPFPSSDWSTSNASLDTTLVRRHSPPSTQRACLTPPSSPASLAKFEHVKSASGSHSDLTSITMGRLRSLWTNLKPHVQEDEDGKYFYMDEQSVERRAQAQASNVIAPVSF